MGLFSKFFKKKTSQVNPLREDSEKDHVRKRKNEPDVFNVKDDSEGMNWAIEKANLTLHYFEDCLKNPMTNQVYFSIKVKIVDGEMVEHIWLSNPTFDEENNLFGTIGNKPIDVTNVQENQKIGIDRDLISDWMIIDNGRLIGGYTIRALRDKLEGEALKSFDRQLGGMIVDYGEDYFPENDQTPEGAILMLELAYDEDNIEKAMMLKDFNKEARLMVGEKIPDSAMQDSPEVLKLIDTMTKALKVAYLESMEKNGIPKFTGVKRAFPLREKIIDDLYIITEIWYWPNGDITAQKMKVWNSGNGWKVLGTVE